MNRQTQKIAVARAKTITIGQTRGALKNRNKKNDNSKT